MTFHEFEGHSKAIQQLIPFPAKQQLLVVSTSLDNTVRIWSLKSLEQVYLFDLGTIQLSSMAFLDNEHVYYTSKDIVQLCHMRYIGESFASFKSVLFTSLLFAFVFLTVISLSLTLSF